MHCGMPRYRAAAVCERFFAHFAIFVFSCGGFVVAVTSTLDIPCSIFVGARPLCSIAVAVANGFGYSALHVDGTVWANSCG